MIRALSGCDSASAHLARDHSPLAGPAFFFFTDAREDMEYVSARCCTATSADPPPGRNWQAIEHALSGGAEPFQPRQPSPLDGWKIRSERVRSRTIMYLSTYSCSRGLPFYLFSYLFIYLFSYLFIWIKAQSKVRPGLEQSTGGPSYIVPALPTSL